MHKFLGMNIQTTRITQILYYLLIVEFLLVMVGLDNKPLIDLVIMKWALIVTALFFVLSIGYFFWQVWNKRNK